MPVPSPDAKGGGEHKSKNKSNNLTTEEMTALDGQILSGIFIFFILRAAKSIKSIKRLNKDAGCEFIIFSYENMEKKFLRSRS